MQFIWNNVPKTKNIIHILAPKIWHTLMEEVFQYMKKDLFRDKIHFHYPSLHLQS